MDNDSLVEKSLVKPAADTKEADEPFLVHLLYHEADLVCMSVDHNRGLRALFRGYEVAKSVHSHLIDVGGDFFFHNLLD